MDENPVFLVFMIAIGVYVARLWWADLRANRARPGEPERGFPGTVPAPRRAWLIALGGTAVLLAAETWGEILLGLSEEQSGTTVLYGAYTLVAAFIEEVVFRGYLVVRHRGRATMIWAVLAASLGFALLHPFLWTLDGGFALTFTPKGWFSFAFSFVGSLWFYACRLAPWNPGHSLLPCFAAHGLKNAGVFVIKAAQGHLVGLW
jgi:membrane protease YdiL (CAAX protease family)